MDDCSIERMPLGQMCFQTHNSECMFDLSQLHALSFHLSSEQKDKLKAEIHIGIVGNDHVLKTLSN